MNNVKKNREITVFLLKKRSFRVVQMKWQNFISYLMSEVYDVQTFHPASFNKRQPFYNTITDTS